MSEVPLYMAAGGEVPIYPGEAPYTLQGYLAYKKTHPPRTLP